MKVKTIVTVDEELNFFDVEIDCKNKKELDKRIANSKIIQIKEGGRIFNLNSSYIFFYEL